MLHSLRQLISGGLHAVPQMKPGVTNQSSCCWPAVILDWLLDLHELPPGGSHRPDGNGQWWLCWFKPAGAFADWECDEGDGVWIQRRLTCLSYLFPGQDSQGLQDLMVMLPAFELFQTKMPWTAWTLPEKMSQTAWAIPKMPRLLGIFQVKMP